METTFTPSRKRIEIPQGLQALVTLALVLGTLAAGYRSALTPVSLVVDGRTRSIRTQQDTVGALLMDQGITLRKEDIVTPALETLIEPNSGMTIQVRRAYSVTVSADGHTVTLLTHADAAEEILNQARVSLSPYDEMEIEGALGAGNQRQATKPPHITVKRAIPFTLQENGQTRQLYTTAPTVGEALNRAGITLYLADYVQPELKEPLSEDLVVSIDRSVPVTLQVDGRTLRTRTHRERIGEVLADLGVVLTGQDYAVPGLEETLPEESPIQVVRVTERFLIEQDPIPFETVWQPDPDLEIDNDRLLQAGAPGTLQRRIRVRYENDQELSRTVENEYVAVQPTTKIMGYGTKIVVRTLDTPSGPVEYWRVMRMLATSYSAGTAGVSPSSPWYGRTATGMKMRHGIVAVDPNVVNLRSQVYVPDYGVGIAGDTGGAIKGRRIDLGYDDDNLVLWYRWVNVYLLTPIPSNIHYNIGP
jgi:uncharacterized protein YabE (DUF348 family)